MRLLVAFPWKNLPEDAVVVDVGGGIGSTSMVLANAYSHLRFVVQDRPNVVAVAPSVTPSSPHFFLGPLADYVARSSAINRTRRSSPPAASRS